MHLFAAMLGLTRTNNDRKLQGYTPPAIRSLEWRVAAVLRLLDRLQLDQLAQDVLPVEGWLDVVVVRRRPIGPVRRIE